MGLGAAVGCEGMVAIVGCEGIGAGDELLLLLFRLSRKAYLPGMFFLSAIAIYRIIFHFIDKRFYGDNRVYQK